MSDPDKFDHLTILHSVSDEVREKVEEAHKLTQQATDTLKIIDAFTEHLKASVNELRSKAFEAACEEYPPLADPNSPCNLDFETGLVVTPKNDIRNPSQAGLDLIQKLLDAANKDELKVHKVMASSPQEAMQKIQEQLAGEEEEEDDKKKIIN